MADPARGFGPNVKTLAEEKYRPSGRLIVTGMALAAVIVASAIGYSGIELRQASLETHQTLQAVANLKIRSIEDWRLQAVEQDRVIAQGLTGDLDTIREAIGGSPDARRRGTELLRDYRSSAAADTFVIVDRDGNVAAASDATLPSPDRLRALLARQVTRQPELVAELVSDPPGILVADAILPIYASDGPDSPLIGGVVIRRDLTSQDSGRS